MDYIELGACPKQEDSVQPLGSTLDYIPAMNEQVYRYLDFLKRRYCDMLKENNQVKLEIRTFGNDTQPFLNVVVVYDKTDEIQAQCSTIISENLPQKWTDTEELYVCL